MTAHTKGGFHVKREEYGHVDPPSSFSAISECPQTRGICPHGPWGIKRAGEWVTNVFCDLRGAVWGFRILSIFLDFDFDIAVLRIEHQDMHIWGRHSTPELCPEYEATPSSDIVRRITMTREKQAAWWREITVTCGLSPDASFCLLCSRACHEAWAHMPPAWLHTASALHVAACSHIAYHYGHHIRQATNHLAAICNKINWDRKATAVYFLASCGTKVEMGKGMCSLGEDGKEKDTSILRKDPKVMGK